MVSRFTCSYNNYILLRLSIHIGHNTATQPFLTMAKVHTKLLLCILCFLGLAVVVMRPKTFPKKAMGVLVSQLSKYTHTLGSGAGIMISMIKSH